MKHSRWMFEPRNWLLGNERERKKAFRRLSVFRYFPDSATIDPVHSRPPSHVAVLDKRPLTRLMEHLTVLVVPVSRALNMPGEQVMMEVGGMAMSAAPSRFTSADPARFGACLGHIDEPTGEILTAALARMLEPKAGGQSVEYPATGTLLTLRKPLGQAAETCMVVGSGHLTSSATRPVVIPLSDLPAPGRRIETLNPRPLTYGEIESATIAGLASPEAIAWVHTALRRNFGLKPNPVEPNLC